MSVKLNWRFEVYPVVPVGNVRTVFWCEGDFPVWAEPATLSVNYRVTVRGEIHPAVKAQIAARSKAVHDISAGVVVADASWTQYEYTLNTFVGHSFFPSRFPYSVEVWLEWTIGDTVEASSPVSTHLLYFDKRVPQSADFLPYPASVYESAPWWTLAYRTHPESVRAEEPEKLPAPVLPAVPEPNVKDLVLGWLWYQFGEKGTIVAEMLDDVETLLALPLQATGATDLAGAWLSIQPRIGADIVALLDTPGGRSMAGTAIEEALDGAAQAVFEWGQTEDADKFVMWALTTVAVVKLTGLAKLGKHGMKASIAGSAAYQATKDYVDREWLDELMEESYRLLDDIAAGRSTVDQATTRALAGSEQAPDSTEEVTPATAQAKISQVGEYEELIKSLVQDTKEGYIDAWGDSFVAIRRAKRRRKPTHS